MAVIRPRVFNSVVLALAAGLFGCAAQAPAPVITSLDVEVPEVRTGILAGYLSPTEMPNSLLLVPPPPAEGSAALALDQAVNAQQQLLRGSARWQLAEHDSHLSFPGAASTFSCALGIDINAEQTPHLVMLLRRSLADAGLSTYGAKNHYQRTRPFVVNGAPSCTPKEEDMLRNDGSYPSGHTAIGTAWGLILAEIAPQRTEQLVARGLAYGNSRGVCNVHWHSDINAGRLMAAATVAKLHSVPLFQADLAAAKQEYAQAVADGSQPRGDCAAEAAALALYPGQQP